MLACVCMGDPPRYPVVMFLEPVEGQVYYCSLVLVVVVVQRNSKEMMMTSNEIKSGLGGSHRT